MPMTWFRVFDSVSGGGFGDPLERAAAEVARDVRQGRLTVLEASSVYGVVVDSSGTPDAAATDRLPSGPITGRGC